MREKEERRTYEILVIFSDARVLHRTSLNTYRSSLACVCVCVLLAAAGADATESRYYHSTTNFFHT